MRMEGMGRVVTIAVVLIALVVTVGCAASRRTQNRVNVLTAENVDLQQQGRALQQQARDAQLAQDRALVELQQQRHKTAQLDARLTDAEREAQEGSAAVARLDQVREDNMRNLERIDDLGQQIERLAAMKARTKTPPAAQPDSIYRPSPHLDAFAADLRGKLRAAGINLPVEMRTTRDGQRRVAIVLPDAFPSGKDSLTYDMDSVRAVVGLGKLIARSYPSSQVSVEGHTDSDPIKNSPWQSNEHLSLARAQSVKSLIVKSGVSSDRVDTMGHGARHPLERGSTARAKSRNRRVEIYIQPMT